MLASEESKGTHHLLMAWEERLVHKRKLLRTQRVEDFDELRELGVREGEQKTVGVSDLLCNKCLQVVLILMGELRVSEKLLCLSPLAFLP